MYLRRLALPLLASALLAPAASAETPADPATPADQQASIEQRYDRDWSAAEQHTPGEAGTASATIKPPLIDLSLPDGATIEEALATLPDDVQKLVKHGVSVNTAAAGLPGTVLGEPGTSLYFAQIYALRYGRLVGCNIELFTDTPAPTRNITFGIATSCSDPGIYGQNIAHLGEVLPRPLTPLANGNFYGYAGAATSPTYYRTEYFTRGLPAPYTGEEQLEQVFGFTSAHVDGRPGVDGWLTDPVSTGEQVSCRGVLTLDSVCAIASKPFAFAVGSNLNCATGVVCAAPVNAAAAVSAALTQAQATLAGLTAAAQAAFDAGLVDASAVDDATAGAKCSLKLPTYGYAGACADPAMTDTSQEDEATVLEPADDLLATATAARASALGPIGVLHTIKGGSLGFAYVRSGPHSFTTGTVTTSSRTQIAVGAKGNAKPPHNEKYYGGYVMGAYRACGWVRVDAAPTTKPIVKRSTGCTTRFTPYLSTNCLSCGTGEPDGFNRQATSIPECVILPAAGSPTASCSSPEPSLDRSITPSQVAAGYAVAWRYVAAKNPDWTMVLDRGPRNKWFYVPTASLQRCASGMLPVSEGPRC